MHEGIDRTIYSDIMKVRNVRNYERVIVVDMEIARLTSKGQVTIPKAIRERLNLEEGDKVAFIEDETGKIVITKSSVIALREFLGSMAKEAEANGITETDMLDDLEQVREEMWNERNK
ncbi:AbrB/MazE/SpoVT family DNA-binding domain-containing protein [Paenibacillus sp. 1P07SE]|uniref:AbrB/MazE/SpoVT family DNA-binding domain-containing protein n=1 Tax=Paenibacillus sp. 1P07SE TaxID=3132209 RepID=UPI0039A4D5EA